MQCNSLLKKAHSVPWMIQTRDLMRVGTEEYEAMPLSCIYLACYKISYLFNEIH